MKKKGLLLALWLVLCLLAATGLCDSYGTAVIYAKNSGKVHLREEASSDSESLGLFFTGTEVEMRSDPDEKWVRVHIEGLSGYIRSSYLRRGEGREGIAKRFQSGTIDAKNYVNFRRGPSTEYKLLGRINAGEKVTVMGETSEHWYYIKYDGDYGYVSANLVRLGGDSAGETSSSAQSSAQTQSSQTVHSGVVQATSVFPSGMPLGWTHTSGAGAWRTQMNLDLDGFFYGYFSDSEMTTVYESSFSGRFTDVYRRDMYSYEMTLSSLRINGTPGDAAARDGLLYITQEPAGLALGDTFVLYLPGTPKERLSQEELPWLHESAENTLSTYFLSNQNSGRGFMPGAQIN